MKTTLLLLLAIGGTVFSIAQDEKLDLIVKKNRDSINCHIVLIDEDAEVLYYQFEMGETETRFSLRFDKIDRVIFDNGDRIDYGANYEQKEEQESFHGLSKNAFKVNLFKPAFGSFALSYEKSFSNKMSLNVEAGVVSEGLNTGSAGANRNNERGGYGRVQARFYTGSMRDSRKARTHPMGGAYIAPEVSFSSFKYSYTTYVGYYNVNGHYVYDEIERQESGGAFALMVHFGKQHVLSDVFVIEYFIGAGLNVGTEDVRLYSHLALGPIAFDTGLRLGFAF